MTRKIQKNSNRYYQWLCTCRKKIIKLKLSMACNIGVADFVHTWC